MFRLHEDWQDADAWDAFVVKHTEGRFCHLFKYSEAVRCYGYGRRRLCFTHGAGELDGEIAAVLPITEVHNYWYGRRLISQPFCEYGGLLVDPRAASESVTPLVESLRKHLAVASPNGVLEIHGNLGVPADVRERFVQRNPHFLAVLPLADGADHIWKKTVKYEVRKAVNQARRAGITCVEECNEHAIREWFFPLYAASMKRLGVPPHKIDYYLDCHRVLGARMQILWAIKDSKRIAGLCGFNSGVRTVIINTVSDPAYWQYRPNDLLHWEFICKAIEQGCGFFDFGSVRYDGQRLYKSKWGCSLVDQAYCFMSGGSQPIRTFDSSSSTMQRFSKFWAQYVPLPVAERIGPVIRQALAR